MKWAERAMRVVGYGFVGLITGAFTTPYKRITAKDMGEDLGVSLLAAAFHIITGPIQGAIEGASLALKDNPKTLTHAVKDIMFRPYDAEGIEKWDRANPAKLVTKEPIVTKVPNPTQLLAEVPVTAVPKSGNTS